MEDLSAVFLVGLSAVFFIRLFLAEWRSGGVADLPAVILVRRHYGGLVRHYFYPPSLWRSGGLECLAPFINRFRTNVPFYKNKLC